MLTKPVRCAMNCEVLFWTNTLLLNYSNKISIMILYTALGFICTAALTTVKWFRKSSQMVLLQRHRLIYTYDAHVTNTLDTSEISPTDVYVRTEKGFVSTTCTL
jgi:hypothetical protein